MSISLEEAIAAIDVLEAWSDGKAADAQKNAAVHILNRATGSGVQENLGRFLDAPRKPTSHGMSRRDWERRAISGMRMGVEIFRNTGHKTV